MPRDTDRELLVVTPWLSGHWKPVRVGCYERNYGPWLAKREPAAIRDWWDGTHWRCLGNRGVGGVCVRQNQAWRGLAAPLCDNYGGTFCSACRETGAWHCAWPEHCGGMTPMQHHADCQHAMNPSAATTSPDEKAVVSPSLQGVVNDQKEKAK